MYTGDIRDICHDFLALCIHHRYNAITKMSQIQQARTKVEAGIIASCSGTGQCQIGNLAQRELNGCLRYRA